MLEPSKASEIGVWPTLKVPRFAPSLARRRLTLLLPAFATHTFAPSKATACGIVPAEKEPRVAPSLARSLTTAVSVGIQMFSPSNAIPWGLGTLNVARLAPSLERSLVTVSSFLFVTQTLSPSVATPVGLWPTGKTPRLAPSLTRSLVTVSRSRFIAQILAPSKAMGPGLLAKDPPRTCPSPGRILRTALLLT